MNPLSEYVNSFIREAESKGFKISSQDVKFDGKIRRVPHGKSKDAGWVAGYDNGDNRLTIVCGSWLDKDEKIIFPNSGQRLNPQQKAAIQKKIEESREKQQREREEIQAKVANEADKIFARGQCGYGSQYLARKGLDELYGARMQDDTLMVPTRNCDDEIMGIQFIKPDGQKKFLAGQKFKGTYHVIKGKDGPMYLCEGFATGASIHEATRRTVVVAFSAQNMEAVAQQFIGYPVVVCGDNDRFTEGNPGEKSARKAAEILNTRYILPTFDIPNGTDFNDYHQTYGIEKLRQLLEAGMDNTPISIKEKREKRNAERGVKLKKADAYLMITKAMNKDPHVLEEFKDRYHVVELKPGVRIPVVEIGPDIVDNIGLSAVSASILKYCHNELKSREHFSFTSRNATECAEFWLSYSDPIEMPKSIRWADESGYTYRRLPWSVNSGPTPVFDEMMARTTNSDALMAFIGSIFVETSDLQQYVWLHGQGQNGKSALVRFVRDVLGNAYRSLSAQNSDSRFWTSNLIGSRLGVFADTNNTSFVTSGLGKSLTGGDPIPFELKNGAYGTIDLKTKFIFVSNSRPAINSEKADIRRLILCEMGEIKGKPDPQYQDKLWDEGGFFLSKCLHKYAELCPYDGAIPITNEDDVRDWISMVEETYEVFFDKNFVLAKNGSITPLQMCNAVKAEWKDTRSQGKFFEWLERTHGIKKKTVRIRVQDEESCTRSNPNTKAYSGIELRNPIAHEMG